LHLAFSAAGLSPGQYEGFVIVQSTISGVQTRIPYWYGVGSGTPQYITTLRMATTLKAGASISNAVVFRISDASGIPLFNIQPTVTVVSGDGQVARLRALDGSSPGAFGVNVVLGKLPGPNVFRIQAGPVTKDITLNAN